MELEVLPWELSVCRIGSMEDVDLDAEVYFIGKTDEELSLVCRTEDVPADAEKREDGWRGFRVRGELDFSLVGILASLSGVLAEAGISLFALSTWNTDYILVKKEQFGRAADALRAAGYRVV